MGVLVQAVRLVVQAIAVRQAVRWQAVLQAASITAHQVVRMQVVIQAVLQSAPLDAQQHAWHYVQLWLQSHEMGWILKQWKSQLWLVIPIMLLFAISFFMIGEMAEMLFARRSINSVVFSKEIFGDFIITSRYKDGITATAGRLNLPINYSTKKDLPLNLKGLEEFSSFLKAQPYIESFIARQGYYGGEMTQINPHANAIILPLNSFAGYDFTKINKYYENNKLLLLPDVTSLLASFPQFIGRGILISRELANKFESELGRPLEAGEGFRIRTYSYDGNTVDAVLLGVYDSPADMFLSGEFPERGCAQTMLMDLEIAGELMCYHGQGDIPELPTSLSDLDLHNLSPIIPVYLQFARTPSQVLIKLKADANRKRAREEIEAAMRRCLPSSPEVERVLISSKEFSIDGSLADSLEDEARKTASLIYIVLVIMLLSCVPALFLLYVKQKPALVLLRALGANSRFMFRYTASQAFLLVVPSCTAGFLAGTIKSISDNGEIALAFHLPTLIQRMSFWGLKIMIVLWLVTSLAMWLNAMHGDIAGRISGREAL